MTFELPPRSKVGYLDPEIAGEGQKVIHSDGEVISWTPPPARPVMPDWSQIKSIAKYFNRTGYQVWPAWVYHPKDEPRLLKNADEGAELGICYRQATADEQMRFGHKAVWDWKEDCEWRPQPYPGTMKFNPNKPETGKTFVASPPNPTIAQNQLVEALIPQVAAAVAIALKGSSVGAAPPAVDPKQWEAFLQFQAWEKSVKVVETVVDTAFSDPPSHMRETDNAPSNALQTDVPAPQTEFRKELAKDTADREWAVWEGEAKNKGVKVDRRWSLARLKEEVEKAAA